MWLTVPLYELYFFTLTTRFTAKLTPEGASLVGPDPNPAVVLPELLELYRAHGLQSSL